MLYKIAVVSLRNQQSVQQQQQQQNPDFFDRLDRNLKIGAGVGAVYGAIEAPSVFKNFKKEEKVMQNLLRFSQAGRRAMHGMLIGTGLAVGGTLLSKLRSKKQQQNNNIPQKPVV